MIDCTCYAKAGNCEVHKTVTDKLYSQAELDAAVRAQKNPMVCGHAEANRVLVVYARPGGPPGNGWGCKVCIEKREAIAAAEEAGYQRGLKDASASR